MKRVFPVVLVVFSLVSTGINAQSNVLFFDEADALFGKYVVGDRVDYGAIQNDPTSLNRVLDLAAEEKVSPANKADYLAYWINTYNIFVIKGVIDNYPLASPLDVEGFFKSMKFKAAGKNITLDAIENNLLRPVIDDARIHFVLVCGARGCPPLINKAYRPENVDQLLQQQTKKALNNPQFIKVSGGKVELSEIFKWYKEDFTKNSRSELQFINKFRKEKIDESYEMSYYPYDWRLNSK